MEKTYFERFFIFNRPALINYALTLAKNLEDAEELVQEAYCKAILKYQTCKKEGSLRSWLQSIVKNIWLNEFKKQKRIVLMSQHTHKRIEEPYLPDERFLPDSDNYTRPYKEQINCALKKIPDPYKKTLLLRDIEGMKYLEIAENEKINIGTVRSRINRARKLLRKELHKIAKQEGLLNDTCI